MEEKFTAQHGTEIVGGRFPTAIGYHHAIKLAMSDLTLSWDELRERARNHTDLTEDKKRDALQAFDTLQSIFGTTFFDDKDHPLFWFFSDRSGWRCEWAIWFANLLQSLNQHADFSGLVNDLKNPMFYDE